MTPVSGTGVIWLTPRHQTNKWSVVFQIWGAGKGGSLDFVCGIQSSKSGYVGKGCGVKPQGENAFLQYTTMYVPITNVSSAVKKIDNPENNQCQ